MLSWSDPDRRYKLQLHQDHIQPAIRLDSDILQDSDVPESANLMHTNGSDVVAVTDEGNELLVAAIPARLDELFQQQPANSLAHGLRTDID